MRNWSLRLKILVTTTLCLVVMTTATLWYSLSSLRTNIDETLQKDVDIYATSFGNSVGEWIQDRRVTMRKLANVIANNPDVPPHIFLDQVKESLGFSLVYFGTTDGDMYRNDPTIQTAGYDPRVRSWYQGVLANNGSFIAPPFVSKSTGAYVVTVAEPVRVNGKLIGVVGGNITLDGLTEKVNSMIIPGKGYAILIDASDQIVAHPDKNWQRKPATELAPVFSPQNVRKFEQKKHMSRIELEGVDKRLYATHIPNTQWSLVLIMDEDTLMAPVRAQLWTQLAIAAAILIVAIIILTFLFKMMFKELEHINTRLNDIANGDGDLTTRLPVNSNDEIGQLATSFNQFVEKLQGIITRLSHASKQLLEQADVAAQSVNGQHERVQRHQTEIHMVATAVTEMASATQEISSNAEQTAHAAGNTVTLSDEGRQQVAQSQQSISQLADEVSQASGIIDELNQHAQDINSILSTISAIAEQTNLLALNAAIEAARAGEQGRGFAVVADEVRVLSQRTHSSTEEIRAMIETLQNATSRAVSTMSNGARIAEQSVNDAEAANQSLAQISQAINQINDMAAQIAAAAEEQASVTIEINRNTEAIREVGDEMSQDSERSKEQASQLRTLGGEVNTEVQKFRI